MHIDFPFGIDETGRTRESSGAEYVRDLMEQILFTAPGERVMRPDFGSGARHLVFEPNDKQLAATTEYSIRGALQQYLGDLIVVDAIQVEGADGTVTVAIKYTLDGEDTPRTERFERRL
jgi:hypothetical protein